MENGHLTLRVFIAYPAGYVLCLTVSLTHIHTAADFLLITLLQDKIHLFFQRLKHFTLRESKEWKVRTNTVTNSIV